MRHGAAPDADLEKFYDPSKGKSAMGTNKPPRNGRYISYRARIRDRGTAFAINDRSPHGLIPLSKS